MKDKINKILRPHLKAYFTGNYNKDVDVHFIKVQRLSQFDLNTENTNNLSAKDIYISCWIKGKKNEPKVKNVAYNFRFSGVSMKIENNVIDLNVDNLKITGLRENEP